VTRDPPSGEAPRPVEPGQLTALLQAIAALPAGGGALPDAPELLPGAELGRFRIVRFIGRGGFGVVYEAHDDVLHRSVALKTLRKRGSATVPQERLLLEAEAAARLSHPNIVTLHDVGTSEGGPYLVMELLRGESLAARLSRGPLPPAEAVRVAWEVARGLAHAHGHGVVHRDLKPANVFLCAEGTVKVLDFGLAQAFGKPLPDGGTPAYMAPEQRTRAPEDERTDVFALGVVLYQMLTGERPFGLEGNQPLWRRARPLEIVQSPALANLVERMLAHDPVRRPRNGGAVADELAAIQRELDTSPSTPSRPVVRHRGRRPDALAGVPGTGLPARAGGARRRGERHG
jgi:serine/threonine protein kinase